MNKRLLFSICALLIVVVVMLDFSQQETLTTALDEPDSPNTEYDYYIDGMTMDSFSNEGEHIYRINSERVTHFPIGDLSLMTAPSFHWFDPKQPEWEMSSQTGILSPDTNRNEISLRLKTNVLANRMDTKDVLSITTDSLTVFPNAREISTEQFVTLRNSTLELSSIGLHSFLEENTINLLSEVRGQYE